MLRVFVGKNIVSSSGAAALRSLFLALTRRPVEGITTLVTRRPLLLLLLLRLAEELARRWAAYRRLELGRLRVQRVTDDVDPEIIQGCLISTENLLSLGRIEKRTLFHRPLLEVLGGNAYLVQEVLEAAQICRSCTNNCIVTRWLPPDERYHVLQSTLNVVSSLFGANFVHFNALGDDNMFKSTWYCLTVMTPTRPEAMRPTKKDQGGPQDTTCTFTDMSRKPRATLRVVIVNESELRRIADDKLRPPSWGFFNDRHAERYRMLVDFSRNFQLQLVRTPADIKAASARSPFTSERSHSSDRPDPPDGGSFRRVSSHPNVAHAASAPSLQALAAAAAQGGDSIGEGTDRGGSRMASKRVSFGSAKECGATKGCLPDDDNCFLRLHVPHYVGPHVDGLASGPHASPTPVRSLVHQRTASTPSMASLVPGAAETGSLVGYGSSVRRHSP